MQTENCHLRSGVDSLNVEVFAAAVADVAFEVVLRPFVKVTWSLNIPAVEEEVAALVSWHK